MSKRGIPYDLIKGDARLVESKPEAPRTIDFLPYVFPPDQFVPFDVVNSQAILAATTVTIPIFGPVNSNAVIRWFANEGALAADVPFLLWTIIVAGVPAQPYVNMLLSRGSIDNPDPIIIRVAPNRIVTVNVQNTDAGAPHTARTRVKGWTY
jgi:hypothetical protein